MEVIIKCPDCEGTGKEFDLMFNLFFGTKKWPTNRICQKCNGLGSLRVDEEDIPKLKYGNQEEGEG